MLLRFLLQRGQGKEFRYLRIVFLMAFIVVWLLTIHLAEIFLWAGYYDTTGYLPDFVTSLYFSMTTYSTLGYGDVVLKGSARLSSGIESLVGLLMIGWSTALLIRVVEWVNRHLFDRWGFRIPD
jgi:voltage-gated potassium channel